MGCIKTLSIKNKLKQFLAAVTGGFVKNNLQVEIKGLFTFRPNTKEFLTNKKVPYKQNASTI